ncbi:heme-binding protein [Algibacter lectus]
MPIINQNKNIIGAIGVSGGTIEQDRDIAIAGANAILNQLKN